MRGIFGFSALVLLGAAAADILVMDSRVRNADEVLLRGDDN